MSRLGQTWIVAVWEFRRYFKWKDQLFGIAFFLLVGGIWAGASIVAKSRGGSVTLAVSGFEAGAQTQGRIRFVPAPESDSAGLESLRAGDVHGLLTRSPDGAFQLLVAKDPRYKDELEALLLDLVRRERLEAAGLSTEDLERLLEPAPLEVRFVDPATQRRGKGEKIASGIFIAVLLTGVFTSMAYLLTGITSEKQLRVTESVVSAISPQAWIDGKLLGITAYSLTGIAQLLIGGLLAAVYAQAASGFALPAAAIRPGVILALLAYAILGLLLWNSFFAAVASTIDDPNTSSRGSMLMLPAIPVLMSIAVLRDPDSLLSRLLALFPLTSAPALPMRLVLSDPGPLEIGASLALLVGATWLTRRLAGRIFEIGMLLYGKEPTLPEVIRWARRPVWREM